MTDMIPIAALERTANALMAKAAIEIPDDYLAGLKRCVDTEKGDLSAFVLKAMLPRESPALPTVENVWAITLSNRSDRDRMSTYAG